MNTTHPNTLVVPSALLPLVPTPPSPPISKNKSQTLVIGCNSPKSQTPPLIPPPSNQLILKALHRNPPLSSSPHQLSSSLQKRTKTDKNRQKHPQNLRQIAANCGNHTAIPRPSWRLSPLESAYSWNSPGDSSCGGSPIWHWKISPDSPQGRRRCRSRLL